ncbi:MAG TPA: M24 family metallopeptidase C-terminal domain-containing protein, partial [Sphingomonas sp.]
TMLGFETLTFAPIERTLVDPALLTPEERAWLDAYHAKVVEVIAPHLDEEDRAWLTHKCAPLP